MKKDRPYVCPLTRGHRIDHAKMVPDLGGLGEILGNLEISAGID